MNKDIFILDYHSRFETKSGDNEKPVYIAPVVTGDELTDLIVETQAIREYKNRLNKYETRLAKNKELIAKIVKASAVVKSIENGTYNQRGIQL